MQRKEDDDEEEKKAESPASLMQEALEEEHRDRVSWKEIVLVHYHEMILGYNLGVSSGAPVELSWEKIDASELALEEKFSRTMKELRLLPSVRIQYCQAAGATMVEIMSRVEAVDIMRQQLAASIKKAKFEDQKALEKAKKAAAKQKKKNAKLSSSQHAQDGCCIIL